MMMAGSSAEVSTSAKSSDAALTEVHVKVALAPTAIVVGEAATMTVGAVDIAVPPPQAVNKPVIKLKARDSSSR